MEKNYNDIFLKAEKSLRENIAISNEEFDSRFLSFRNLTFVRKTDDEYFDILKLIIFYSGFKAETVNKKLGVIRKHFPDFKTISNYGDIEKDTILSDMEMIKNETKISAVIQNAKTFQTIVNKYGSFYDYIESFKPTISFENLMLLKEELEYKFDYLGGITVYHFLTDIGLDVLKPDRVLTRIYKRLGLIEDERQLLKTVIQGRKFAEATGKSIRYVDIIFVTYGQQAQEGICFSKNPKCNICSLREYCNYNESLN